MITLITGSPGSGKTALLVSELMKCEGRPLFVDGVTDLQLPHEEFNPEEWPKELPDGALAAVDECQRIWRPRGSGSKVPPSVAEFETHRHHGLDFFLITQSPTLLDSNVRKLVGRHLHIVGKWNGRTIYEWPECKTDPTQGRQTAVSRPFTLPKKTFDQYKSAEVHTKLERKKPVALYVLGIMALLLVFVGTRVYSRMSEVTDPVADTVIERNTDFVSLGGADATTGDPFDFTPRLKYRPETAPAYDQVREVTDVPNIKACIESASFGCRCYTGQASIYPAPDAVCREIVAGRVFDPYRSKGSSDFYGEPDIPLNMDQKTADIKEVNAI